MLTCECHLTTPMFDAALRATDDVRISLDQQTVTSSGDVAWVVRAEGSDVAAFEEGLDADPTVADYTVIGGDRQRRLYHVRLSRLGQEQTASSCWAEANGQFLDATHHDGQWTVRLRFPNREAVRAFFECCADLDGVTASLGRLYESDKTESRPYGLSRPQLDALRTAFEAGYFDIPRSATLNDLAAELDVSDNAVSERLRRGMESVLAATFAELDDSGEASDDRQ